MTGEQNGFDERQAAGKKIAEGWTEHVIEGEVRVAYKDHWEQFQEEWKRLPPLVRAGISVWLVEQLGKGNFTQRTSQLEGVGLERRAKVCRRFDSGHAAVQRLFITLCKEADAEAEAKGIDADTEPGPFKDKFYIATKTWPDPTPKKPRKKKR